jgi:hypothetical protein
MKSSEMKRTSSLLTGKKLMMTKKALPFQTIRPSTAARRLLSSLQELLLRN